jgi:hypothetical protein
LALSGPRDYSPRGYKSTKRGPGLLMLPALEEMSPALSH